MCWLDITEAHSSSATCIHPVWAFYFHLVLCWTRAMFAPLVATPIQNKPLLACFLSLSLHKVRIYWPFLRLIKDRMSWWHLPFVWLFSFPQDKHSLQLIRCESGNHYLCTLLGDIYMTCQQGTVWIIDIFFFPACPCRRRTLIPWERGEIGIEEVIT